MPIDDYIDKRKKEREEEINELKKEMNLRLFGSFKLMNSTEKKNSYCDFESQKKSRKDT